MRHLFIILLLSMDAYAETPLKYAKRKSCEIVQQMSGHKYKRQRIRRKIFLELYKERRGIEAPEGLEKRIPSCRLN